MDRLPWRSSLACLAAAALLAGCTGTDTGDGVLDDVGCSTCHGSAANAAPPSGIEGETETTALAVGAHQAHLVDGAIRGAVDCGACHVVPETIVADGHADGLPAEVVWGDLATTGGQTPRWSRDGATCSSVYCHGATLMGGQATAPVWTRVDGSQTTCDGCHGNPPPAPHPQSAVCRDCHPATVAADGTIDVAGGHHVDGVVDGPGASCNGCHGNDDNAAPPFATNGARETTAVEVGAHQNHLRDGDIRAALACTECHVVPTVVDAAGHVDGPPAEVRFGSLASTGGLTPYWERDYAACASTYCHGATLAGGRVAIPTWTTVDGSQSTCDACHGNPPPAPHPADGDCAACHPATVRSDGRIDVAGGRHVDGVLDVETGCGTCHGSEDNAAPPAALDGATDTSAVAVGAHQAHLRGGVYRAAVGCDACHVVPASYDAAGHVDEAPADIAWGALATNAGAEPAWDRDAATCASTYCHGATLRGGRLTDPAWTVVDGSQVGCDTCHGNPPPAPHPANGACAMCHPDTVTAEGAIDLESENHINGTVEVFTHGK